MNSLKPSIVILAGNHKAFSAPNKGHNGKILGFNLQEEALTRACEVYQKVIEQNVPAHLYTAIDHIGGRRVLTGKRANTNILGISDLVEQVREPLLRILLEQKLNPLLLKVVPEKTLLEHSQHLHGDGVFTEATACSVFKSGGMPGCKGLAGAYMDLAVRDSLKSGPVGSLDFFIEEGPAVPSLSIYQSGASIVRFGMNEKPGFPKWTNDTIVRGFQCKHGQVRRIA